MYFGAMKKCYTSAILLGVAGLMTLPLGAQMLYDNADDVRQVTYGFNVPFLQQLGNGTGGTQWPGWHGTLIEYAANPFPDAVNGSAQCLAYLRNPGELTLVMLRMAFILETGSYLRAILITPCLFSVFSNLYLRIYPFS